AHKANCDAQIHHESSRSDENTQYTTKIDSDNVEGKATNKVIIKESCSNKYQSEEDHETDS
ncbi:hypothetical protein L9F63_010586, partial [Diploptera punctata]